MKIKIPKATSKQVEYLQILAIDLNINFTQRRALLLSDFNIKHFDELTIEQATSLIDKWIKQKVAK